MKRSLPSGETGDCQVERSPEQMHGRSLAEKARAEMSEHARHARQRPVEALDRVPVIRTPGRVVRERDRILDFVGPSVERRRPAHFRNRTPGAGVELGDAHRFQGKARSCATVGIGDERVIAEVEAERNQPGAVRNRSGRQSARCHVERRVPGVIDPRHMRQTVFPGDLAPHVQCGAGLLPFRIRDGGPAFVHPAALREPWRGSLTAVPDAPAARQMRLRSGWVMIGISFSLRNRSTRRSRGPCPTIPNSGPCR